MAKSRSRAMRRGFADCGSRAKNNYARALAASGADKKRGDDDLLAKERHAASETQRDFSALKKSKKSDFAAKAASGADLKFCAHTLITSGKFFTRDFAAYDAGKNLAPPIFRCKARAENSA